MVISHGNKTRKLEPWQLTRRHKRAAMLAKMAKAVREHRAAQQTYGKVIQL